VLRPLISWWETAASGRGPLIFSGFSLLSWALRPASRRLLGVALPATGKCAITWAIPIFTVTAMLVVAFFTLPKGEPPLEDGNQPLLHDGESKSQTLKRRCFWGNLGRRLTLTSISRLIDNLKPIR
jgi:hypothetical protein